MTTICATESVTLDGVMQGPGRADEDTRGGFAHGGWGDGYSDQVMTDFMGEGMGGEGAMLFGHRSYRDLLQHWTTTPEPNPFGGYLTQAPKYVVSRSAGTRLAFPNSTLLAGDAADTVARLKSELDGDINIIGSGELVRTLHAAGLVDQFVLLVHPVMLGSGQRLFGDAERRDLTLTRSAVTTTGVVIAQYDVRQDRAR